MPPYGPVTNRDLVAALKRAGFDGPYPGSAHRTMNRGGRSVTIPNPHGADIGTSLLARILRRAAISREEWERL